jgi:iron complex outermembrane receptor protein
MKIRTRLLLSAIAATAAVPAWAEGPAIEEVVVTARKREESLLQVPVAISAISAETIDRAGYKGLEDLALHVAGLQYSDQGGQRPGRMDSAIRFRGMNVNSALPPFQLGSLFVDGIFVLGETGSIPLDDVERVEVIKGPQAAYFGRNTFGGAVNYITRQPSTTAYSGKVQASAATYNEFDVSASHEGPLVDGKLGYRVGTRLYSKGAMWRASDGGALGQQSTKTIQGTLFATPTDNLKLRLRGFFGSDDDGPAAGGFIGGAENDSCSGKTVTWKAGGTSKPINWFCGAVPSQGAAISKIGDRQIINSATSITPGIATLLAGDPNFIRNQVLNARQPAGTVGVPRLDGEGLKRNIARISAFADYEFANGIAVAVQGGYDDMRVNWLRDQGLSAITQNYSSDPQKQRDYSIEGRVTSAQNQRLRWMGGVNYYHQIFSTQGGGGRLVVFCWDKLPGVPATSPDCAPNIAPVVQTNNLAGSDTISTTGIFGALGYDITQQITVNLEGRYQIDKESAGGIPFEYKSFLPRTILQYRPAPETNLYASWSVGVLPGAANTRILTADAQELAQYKAQFGNNAVGITPEERLNSFEIGWKQRAWDNRVTFSADAYYGRWKNQKSRANALIVETCRSLTQTGCIPSQNGAALGQPQRDFLGNPLASSRDTIISSTSDIWGAEFEGQVAVTPELSVTLTVDYAASKLKYFFANFIASYTNFTDMAGNANPRYPKWSGSITPVYTHALNETWDWFVRGDISYTGKTYVDVDNLAYCKPYWLVNARAGIERKDVRVELWVKNLFNDDNWAACARWTDFTRPIDFSYFTYYQGVAVTPQNKRQFGIKTSVTF